MNALKKITATVATVGVVAVPTAMVLTASPAAADIERRGACGVAAYEFTVDREDGGFEVSVDLEHARPGSHWRVALRHDGTRFYRNVLTADREGDIDVERFRRNTAGADVFTMRVTNVVTGRFCTARISVS